MNHEIHEIHERKENRFIPHLVTPSHYHLQSAIRNPQFAISFTPHLVTLSPCHPVNVSLCLRLVPRCVHLWLHLAAFAFRVFRVFRGFSSICLTLTLLLTTLLHAQFGQSGKAKNFKFPEFYPVSDKVPPNRLKLLITGAEAEPRSKDLVDVTQMRLETYAVNGRTNIIAKAPQCLVDLEQRQVSSTGRLEMTTGNGQFFLEGNEGFFCRLTNFNLVVSNHGRTVIRHGLLKLPAR